MKKYYFIICCLVFSTSSFGQQFLWSTANESAAKYVPLKDVSNEILKFYDYYDFYIDGAGYNKDTFFKLLGKYGGNTKSWNDFKNEIRKIEKLTVFAIRANSGKGSEILVIFITKDNVNILSFTNSFDSDVQIRYPHKRKEFEDWLETLKD
jgi:hypothetical protein